jgi:hypothetical protein
MKSIVTEEATMNSNATLTRLITYSYLEECYISEPNQRITKTNNTLLQESIPKIPPHGNTVNSKHVPNFLEEITYGQPFG